MKGLETLVEHIAQGPEPKLKQRAKRLGAKIYFWTRRVFKPIRHWALPMALKASPVVKPSGPRQSLNVISAVNARGEFWAVTYPDKLDAKSFVLFLTNFMKGRPVKVFLVVDGHLAHKANLVKTCAQSLRGRLALHFIPPRAPDLNPDEFIWSYMKNNGVSKKPLKQNESFQKRIEEDLNKAAKNGALVRSLFVRRI